jgi:hypothetical protein
MDYLTAFENLRVLNIAGNAVCKNANFKYYVLSHLRRLKYLDYRLVDDETMSAAKDKYIDVVMAHEEEEKIINSKRDSLQKQREQDEMYEEAHILGIDSLFDLMFNDDYDFNKLLPIGPAQINEIKEEYRVKFEIAINEMKHFVLKRSNDKKDEIKALMACVANVKGGLDKEAIARLNEFQHNKKVVCLT